MELILDIEEVFGLSLEPGILADVLTVGQLVELVCNEVRAVRVTRPCLSQKEFYDLRKSLETFLGGNRSAIRVNSRIGHLFQKPLGSLAWRRFCRVTKIVNERSLNWRWWTVRDLVEIGVRAKAKSLKNWSRGEVRTVVRMLVRQSSGYVGRFEDSAGLVVDLGLG